MSSIVQEMDDVVRDAKSLAKQVASELESTAKRTGAFLEQGRSDLEQGLILDTETEASIDEKMKALEARICQSLEQHDKELMDKFDRVLDAMERLNERTIGQMLGESIKDEWNKLKDFVKDAKDSVKNFFVSVKEKVSECVHTMKDRADAYIAFKVKQPIKETVEAIRDAVDNCKEAVKTKAVECGRGIVNGMEKATRGLADKLASKADSFADKRDKLDEKLADKTDVEKAD